MNKNITLSLDEAVIEKVRLVAAKKKTSVNAMVREYLTHMAERENRAKEAVHRMREIAEQGGMEVGKVTWTREDLYDR